jgi:hypothetical protein
MTAHGRFGKMDGGGVVLMAVLLAAPPTDSASPRVCRDARDCNVAGTRALRSGQMATAQAAFEAEVRFAWCEGDAAGLLRAHNNLALLALRRGEPLEARLWADVALRLDAKSPAALYNARTADERAARLPLAPGVTGTYQSAGGDSLVNTVYVRELDGNRMQFELWASGAFSCVDLGHHEGGESGIVVLTGRDAVFETKYLGEPCRLRFTFGPDVLTLSQEGSPWDCGFGDRVYADGSYRRTSRKTPRFTPGLAR